MRISASLGGGLSYDPALMEGGKVIRDWREGFGWTQTVLAVKAGVSQALVQQFETGKRIPERPRIRLMVQALGKSLDEYDRAVADNVFPDPRGGNDPPTPPQSSDSGRSTSTNADAGRSQRTLPDRMNAAELARQLTEQMKKGGDMLTFEALSKMAKRAEWSDPPAGKGKK